MDESSSDLQYLIREHMIENSPNKDEIRNLDNGMLEKNQHLHLRWNSQKGKIRSCFVLQMLRSLNTDYLFLLMVCPLPQFLRFDNHMSVGRIFIDGSHMIHNLELGDEILINSRAPPLALYSRWD